MFLPSVEEVYPTDYNPNFDLDGLDSVMEGAPAGISMESSRVNRLFSIVQPTKAYFGKKDFQQLAIIRYMMPQLGHSCSIIGCPTLREGNV